MDTTSVEQWVREEILERGFGGACGVASFSHVYNHLMPAQKKEVERICDSNFDAFLTRGSFISIAVFHTEKAVKSINVTTKGKVDYEKWDFYADEYNRINNVLNSVCAKLASKLEGFPFRATSELGRKVRSVEEYYPFAKISHRVVAEHAGIGARGKSELIVTRQNGPAVRLNSFLTPRELDRSDKIGDLCGTCRACLDSCQILKRKTQLKNYRQQCMERINALNLRHPVCGICVKACYESGEWRS